jgi:hypothetical protein
MLVAVAVWPISFRSVLKFVRTIFETDARVVAVPEVVTAVAPNTPNREVCQN